MLEIRCPGVAPVDSPVDESAIVESWGSMREFYSQGGCVDSRDAGSAPRDQPLPTRARVAVYDSAGSAPRVVEVDPAGVAEYLENLTTTVYHLAKEQGGDIPYTVIREVTENFIHASFAEPVVSVMDSGTTVRFADQGPGFSDSARASLPGFTTATQEMKRFIRGVGSGLPIVKDYLSISGGTLSIEDNLGLGSVITICSRRSVAADPRMDGQRPPSPVPGTYGAPSAPFPSSLLDEPALLATPLLSTRQKQVLALVMESGSAGPSLVSKELDVGISTAYRDLASLEEMGLISAEGGKRRLTDAGMSYLDDLMAC